MTVLSPELRAQASAIVARYPQGRERSAILPLLYLVQSVEGSVTQEGLREVARLLGLTTAEVEAVASFYTMLRLRPTRAPRAPDTLVHTFTTCAPVGLRRIIV